ncbi:MAG TPA: hypothetical protein VMF05_03345 [Stellaceae bacterium]|nr:hypothetical protein [Stellaceae bacterium]
MTRLRLRPLLASALCLALAGAAGGCVEKPYLSSGDANSAAVGFSGDLAAATAVARQHCLRYDRVPRFLDAEENIAYFSCERH